MEFVAFMPFLVGAIAILAGAYVRTAKIKAEAARGLRDATGHLEDELDAAEAERQALQRRIETLEAIVTGEGFELEREARRAGLLGLDLDAPDLDAPDPELAPRRRSRARS